MKKKGILNREIARALARLGHTDTIIIADCGLPIPDDVSCIDLSIELGNPSFTSVLKTISNDMEIEKMTLANEIVTHNESLHAWFNQYYQAVQKEYLSHEEIKKRIREAKVVIRTGEATPYANVILQSGVIF